MKFKEWLVNGVVSSFFRLTCRLHCDDLDRLPKKGPAIIISNHTSVYEGPLYYVQLRPRRTVALAKKELWDHWATRMAMTAWDSIPVDRQGVDIKAIRRCMGVLDQGNFLCIAPEGHRSKDGSLLRGRPGTTFFAAQAGVPVYPLVHWGALDIGKNLKKMRRTDLHVRMGKPFMVQKPEGKMTPEQRQKMTDEMMYRLADLLPEELRGKYAEKTDQSEEFLKDLV